MAIYILMYRISNTVALWNVTQIQESHLYPLGILLFKIETPCMCTNILHLLFCRQFTILHVWYCKKKYVLSR